MKSRIVYCSWGDWLSLWQPTPFSYYHCYISLLPFDFI